MRLSGNLLHDVRRLAKEHRSSITIDDVLHSAQFNNYVNHTIAFLTGKYGVGAIQVHIVDCGPDGFTAFTTGDTISLNVGTWVASRYESMVSRFIATMGLVFHESAHCLFCDFEEEAKALRYVREGRFYGGEPRTLTEEDENSLAQLRAAMAVPSYAPLFTQIYHELANYLDDVHDEARMAERFGDYVRNGLMLTADSLRRSVPSLEKMEREGYPPLSIFYNLLLQKIRFGDVLTEREDTLSSSPYLALLRGIEGDISAARTTDDPFVRFTAINQMVLALWPLIRDMLPETADPGPEPDQGSAEPVMDALRQGARQAGGSAAPEKRKSSGTARAATQRAKKKRPDEASRDPEGDTGPSSRNREINADALDALLSEISVLHAEAAVEDQLSRDLTDEIRGIPLNANHRDIPLDILRIRDVTQADIERCEREMETIRASSKRAAADVGEALRDAREGTTARHRLSGSRLDAGDTYRPDQRFWSRRRAPQDIPEAAICVLVDHSGSMNGERIECSRRAAMLLHDFCTRLRIPVQICGHRTNGLTVEFIVYTDYRSVGSRDRWRLARMSAGGSNRDGMALEIAASMLARRPEEIKLLFLISDGKPNHHGYRGDAAVADIRAIVKRCRKQGIEILACAIGSDREYIRNLYGDGFLNVEDLSRFPSDLLKLVRKRLL